MDKQTSFQDKQCYICGGEPFKTVSGGRWICEEHANLPKQQPIKYVAPIQGRNEQCKCGSGLKFKRCCWIDLSKFSQL